MGFNPHYHADPDIFIGMGPLPDEVHEVEDLANRNLREFFICLRRSSDRHFAPNDYLRELMEAGAIRMVHDFITMMHFSMNFYERGNLVRLRFILNLTWQNYHKTLYLWLDWFYTDAWFSSIEYLNRHRG